jgi:hypothetical protein
MAKMLAATLLLSMVIRPALSKINLWSPSAEELVLGTAIVESDLTYLRQHNDGPALGLWQVEPSTQNDLYTNFLQYRPELGSALMELRAPNLSKDENLATNLMYGAAVCRLCYYRKAEALPEAGDIEGQAAFWKQHYNTPLGKGTVTKYVYKVQKILKVLVPQ